MSRLIDADDLIEFIKESKPLNWTDSESEIQEDADYNHFIEMVNAQPTAYDVEKVVAEVKDDFYDINFMYNNCSKLDDLEYIIRKGGVE